jgi:DNA primase
LKAGLNVRVLLFPDGEDPDSFSRKTGTTGFQQYLKEHTQDFVSFKADLFATEAGNDPIRKAEVVQELIKTISIVPDFVKRTIYLQEASKIMDIPLAILNSELNKVLIKERVKQKDKGQTEPLLEEENKLSLSDLHELSKSLLYDYPTMLQLFEKEFLRVLIRNGNQKIDGGEFGYEYLFHETDDVSFVDPINTDIMDIYKVEIAKGNIPDPANFSKILPSKYQNRMADLVISKYSVSEGWEKNNIFIGPEYEADKAVKKVVNRLKLGFIQKMIHDGATKIKDSKSIEEETNLLEIQMQLEEAKSSLSMTLGITILELSNKSIQN